MRLLVDRFLVQELLNPQGHLASFGRVHAFARCHLAEVHGAAGAGRAFEGQHVPRDTSGDGQLCVAGPHGPHGPAAGEVIGIASCSLHAGSCVS